MQVIHSQRDGKEAIFEIERLKKSLDHPPFHFYILWTSSPTHQLAKIGSRTEEATSQIRTLSLLDSTIDQVSSILELLLERWVVSTSEETGTAQEVYSQIIFTLTGCSAQRKDVEVLRRIVYSREVACATRTMTNVSHGEVHDIFDLLQSSSHQLVTESNSSKKMSPFFTDALFEFAVGTEACDWSGQSLPTLFSIFSQGIKANGETYKEASQ